MMSIVAKLEELPTPMWIGLAVLGLMFWWPLGLGVLAYLIWSGIVVDLASGAGTIAPPTWVRPRTGGLSHERAATGHLMNIELRPCAAWKKSTAHFRNSLPGFAWPRTRPSLISSRPSVPTALSQSRWRNLEALPGAGPLGSHKASNAWHEAGSAVRERMEAESAAGADATYLAKARG